MAESTEEKLPIAAAAREVGQPERSLFRAVEKGRVPSTKRDGITVVSIAEVRAWAAQRAAANEGAAIQIPPPAAVTGGSLPSGHAGVAAGSGRAPPGLDGETAANLFAAFERGETPIAIVQTHRLSPPTVLAAHRQYLELRAAAVPTGAQAKGEQLEATVSMLVADFNGLQDAIVRMERDHAALAERVQSMPVPERGAFTVTAARTPSGRHDASAPDWRA